jgi:5'-3' exonuclease
MFEVQINKNKPFILIDGSYYIFYRYFATFRWFGFKGVELEPETIIQNEEFIKAFIKHFNADMQKLTKKWKTEISNVILCMDCPRCKIWRNDIYPVYKASRIQNVKFNRDIFKVFIEYLNSKKFNQIYFERLEADDIIYLIQKKIKYIFEEKNINQNIVIITNDNDYLQLADNNIKIINMQMKDITLRGKNNPKIDLLIKAIAGDKSDNIPKISSSMTKEKSEKIACMDDEERNKYLIENNLLDKYNFNMTLISFDNIPIELIKNFYENITFTIF